VTRRRLVALSALCLMAACGAAASPTPDGRVPAASQAATAAALANAGESRPAPTGPAIPPANAPLASPAQSPKPLQAAAVPGRIVVVRENQIDVVESGAARAVFTSDPGGNVKDPAFSPDGSQIAFAYAPPRPQVPPNAPITDQLFYSDLMLVGADGANPRTALVHDQPGAILETPSWTPDGSALYFSYYAPQYQGQSLVGETIELRRIELATGAVSTVAQRGNAPTAAPDGKSLAYVGEDPAQGPDLRLLRLDGSGESAVVPAGEFAGVLAPRFSPDGLSIAFSGAQIPRPVAPPKAASPLESLAALLGPRPALAHGLPWEIFTVPVGGGPAKQLTLFAEDTPYAAWSADSRQLLVYAAGGLYLIDATSGSTQALSTDGAHGGMDWRSSP
jgi:dipeptidyl aminopeptidase/acylaminoacyl peptidase